MIVSVVMAVHNQLSTLPTALDSIINQTLTDWELILIADGCDMETEIYLGQFCQRDDRVKLIINRKHLGLTKSLNKGLKIAKGRYFARMDGDDEALPNRLADQVEYLKKHPKVKLLGTAVNLVNSDGKTLGLKRFPSDDEHIRQDILSFCPFVHPTWMVLTVTMREMSGYNPDFIFAQDYELALRIVAKHEVANLAEPLLNYRVNSPEAISLAHLKSQERLAIKARWLALTRYGYSWLESWRLIKPLLSYLVPVKLKRRIYQRFFWRV